MQLYSSFALLNYMQICSILALSFIFFSVLIAGYPFHVEALAFSCQFLRFGL